MQDNINIDFKSQNFGFCIDCDCFLTKENKSEWEVFIDDTNKTYPICNDCNLKREKIIDKEIIK